MTTGEKSSRMSRRTVVKGAAWAVPAVAVASATPRVAASVTTTTTTLPTCVSAIRNESVNWVVDGAQYPGCSCGSHRDVRLSFDVQACDKPVSIRVYNVAGASMWCAWTTSVSSLTKSVPVNTDKTLTFPDTGDTVGGCKIVAHTDNAVNDGLHVNPCVNGPYFRYQVSYDNGATWSALYDWGTLADVPSPCSGTTTTTKATTKATTTRRVDQG